MRMGYKTCPEHGHQLLETTRTARDYANAEVKIYLCPDERDMIEYWVNQS
jgi:hypothetical protein